MIDPEWIAIVGTIGGGIVLRGVENFLKKSKKSDAKHNQLVDEPKPDEAMCPTFVTRIFEQRLVDAGIISTGDMTRCEADSGCLVCHPPKPVVKAPFKEIKKAHIHPVKKDFMGYKYSAPCLCDEPHNELLMDTKRAVSRNIEKQMMTCNQCYISIPHAPGKRLCRNCIKDNSHKEYLRKKSAPRDKMYYQFYEGVKKAQVNDKRLYEKMKYQLEKMEEMEKMVKKMKAATGDGGPN